MNIHITENTALGKMPHMNTVPLGGQSVIHTNIEFTGLINYRLKILDSSNFSSVPNKRVVTS